LKQNGLKKTSLASSHNPSNRKQLKAIKHKSMQAQSIDGQQYQVQSIDSQQYG